ncbi:hypothetical protein GcM1_145002, partial [Golovinomyces cichoracearum]
MYLGLEDCNLDSAGEADVPNTDVGASHKEHDISFISAPLPLKLRSSIPSTISTWEQTVDTANVELSNANEKAARRKVEFDSANSTIDQVKKRAQQLETELASAKDKIKSLTKQLDADKSRTESKRAAVVIKPDFNIRGLSLNAKKIISTTQTIA